ncbi:MAG: FmdB family zinc ribbon protein [Chromatiales bacterium]
MPIYEYLCAACGHELEAMQSISEAPLKQCPSCNRKTLRKVVSAAGFVLKGTGWYVTDFRDKGKPATDNKGKGESEPTADKKTEDTPKADGTAESKKSTEKTKAEKKTEKKAAGSDS